MGLKTILNLQTRIVTFFLTFLIVRFDYTSAETAALCGVLIRQCNICEMHCISSGLLINLLLLPLEFLLNK